MSTGQATARKRAKPTVEEREHILKYHLEISIEEEAVVIKYLCICNRDDCPVPTEVVMSRCKKPPC
jgi:hypothetical protein